MVRWRKTLIVLFAFTFIVSLASFKLQPFVLAQYSGMPTAPPEVNSAVYSGSPMLPEIAVNSPINNTTYHTNSITLNVSIYDAFDTAGTTRQASYTLDGQESVPLSIAFEGIFVVGPEGEGTLPYSVVVGFVDLPMLSDGVHNVTVNVEYTFLGSNYNHGANPLSTIELQTNSTSVFFTNTQLTPAHSTTVTPKQSPTPTVPELSWLVIVPLLLSVFSVVVIVRHQKTADATKQVTSSRN